MRAAPNDQRDEAKVARLKAKLLPAADREEIETLYGKAVGPIIDAKLEARAQELLGEYRQAWQKTYSDFFGDMTQREVLLVSREEAAALLNVSLSTIKRMEDSGELPEPRKFGERNVRHRLVDIERIANVRLAIWPE